MNSDRSPHLSARWLEKYSIPNVHTALVGAALAPCPLLGQPACLLQPWPPDDLSALCSPALGGGWSICVLSPDLLALQDRRSFQRHHRPFDRCHLKPSCSIPTPTVRSQHA